jgi:hypothetical protein
MKILSRMTFALYLPSSVAMSVRGEGLATVEALHLLVADPLDLCNLVDLFL